MLLSGHGVGIMPGGLALSPPHVAWPQVQLHHHRLAFAALVNKLWFENLQPPEEARDQART